MEFVFMVFHLYLVFHITYFILSFAFYHNRCIWYETKQKHSFQTLIHSTLKYERIDNQQNTISYPISNQKKKKCYQLRRWAYNIRKIYFSFHLFISFCDRQPNLVFGMPILFEFAEGRVKVEPQIPSRKTYIHKML